MADEDTIFEDGENLQAAITKSLHEKKALLCFVSDEGEESSQWEVALLDLRIKDKLLASTVALRLSAGSEQAGFLNAVAPIQSVPAVIIIFNAQVVANYQSGQTSFAQLQSQLEERYTSVSTEDGTNASSSRPRLPGYLDLPPSEGRMRLPNNAYDHLKMLTQRYLDSGVSGKGLLHIQLMLLQSMDIELITAAVKNIQEQFDTITEPKLSDEVINRLLNTPASKIRGNFIPVSSPPRSFQASTSASSSSTQQPSQTVSDTTTNTDSSAQGAQTASVPTQSRPPQPITSPRSNTATAQRAEYVQAQKAAEAERARIKAQIEADKRARRETDRKAHDEAEALRRRKELQELRKANSTTSDPKATDVRIQVRLFDGGTIRNSFSAESTISQAVRPWIDEEVRKKSDGGNSIVGQPYNLKLTLSPSLNRNIEAGEEDNALSDIEGVRGSATLVMVPVKTFVESYGSPGGGIVGSAVGAAQSVVGTGVGLIGSAAGAIFGGLGRLVGSTSSTSSSDQTGAINAGREVQDRARPGQAPRTTNGRVRTLADQRKDDEDDAKKRGTQLYNGMGLNVQPRRDEGESDESKNK